MNFITKFFSFKRVAVIDISCTIPHNGDIIHFSMDVKLYENKQGDRKSSYKPDEYPVTLTTKTKALIEKFLSGQVIPEIPTYSRIIAGEEPAKIPDSTSICSVL
jgi:hypothetical protein